MSESISAISKADRPREKLLQRGPMALSDRELLAILLGTGMRGTDVLKLAGKVATVIDKKGLKVQAADLRDLDGIGDAKATLILASLEFARRRITSSGAKIETPEDLLPFVRHFADRKQEHFICASINGANELLHVRVISIGLIDRTPIHPREVFADALVDRASAIMVAHNHPNGGVKPSVADIEATRQLKAVGNVIGVALLDHVIFDSRTYFSFMEAGVL